MHTDFRQSWLLSSHACPVGQLLAKTLAQGFLNLVTSGNLRVTAIPCGIKPASTNPKFLSGTVPLRMSAVVAEESLEFHQLRSPRNQLQDRVLRRRIRRQNHEPAAYLQKTAEQQKGKMISLATETERTLFFDFLPLDLGSVRGFKTRIHLYTVPGQVFYDASRKLILRGVDGIVFVADSQKERMDANVEALDNLRRI